VQRVDGFVSADFAGEGGSCQTAAVKIDGTRLLVNFDAGALGELRVGLMDTDGKTIAGYGVDDCEILRMNSTHAEVKWKGGNLAALRDHDVHLVFTGGRAKLYGFYFVNGAL
jgi:hypothetical protein